MSVIIKDSGILLSCIPFQESKLLIHCFLKENGIIAGLISSSSKGAYYANYAVGSIVCATWKGRLREQLGYYRLEHLLSTISYVIQNKTAVLVINSIVAMLRASILERDPHVSLFNVVENTLRAITQSDSDLIKILSLYIEFELELLMQVGFGLDLTKCAVTGKVDDLYYISPKSGKSVARDVGLKYHDLLFKMPDKIKTKASLKENLQSIQQWLEITFFFLNKHIFHIKKMPESRKCIVNYIDRRITQI